MKPIEVRVAIAKAVGWRAEANSSSLGGYVAYGPSGHRSLFVAATPDVAIEAECPRYEEDLNAMHEAEKVLTREQWPGYHAMACGIFQESSSAEDGAYETHATAAQRAEAFLRTINEWKE
jgi:hypothetical protein